MMSDIITFLASIFTLENITLVLSLFGSAGTAWTIIQSRRKIMVIADKVEIKNKRVTMNLQIVNQSRLAIVVTDVSWILPNQTVSCTKKRFVDFQDGGTTRNAVPYQHTEYTQPFPLEIHGLGGIPATLRFEFPEGALPSLSTPLTLKISTNRGPVTVSLPPQSQKNN